MKTITVPDMMCPRCVARIKRALDEKSIPAEVTLEGKKITLEDEYLEAALAVVTEAGYKPEAVKK